MRVKYIQRKDSNGVETVDQFNYSTKQEIKEFRRVLKEYIISDNSAYYYPSQRACNDWKN